MAKERYDAWYELGYDRGSDNDLNESIREDLRRGQVSSRIERIKRKLYLEERCDEGEIRVLVGYDNSYGFLSPGNLYESLESKRKIISELTRLEGLGVKVGFVDETASFNILRERYIEIRDALRYLLGIRKTELRQIQLFK